MPEREETNRILHKYKLNASHGDWQPEIDNWYSIEAMRRQLGRLPEEGDDYQKVLMDFLDNKTLHFELLNENLEAFGSMWLSAKRALYRSLHKENSSSQMPMSVERGMLEKDVEPDVSPASR